jgi:hypothetical protein
VRKRYKDSVLENAEPAASAIAAIRSGDVEGLRELLAKTPGLATATIHRCEYTYPVIGAATDWPGNFPRVAETIALLVAAGADVNARAGGPHRETPLHGAASCDDVIALDALLDAGANIDADGAVIAGGTPLDDAVAFGQWKAARRLVDRGARTAVWHAAALGLMDRIAAHFAAGRPPAPHPWGGGEHDEVTVAFWCACAGGQREAAEYLLARGAIRDWRAPWDDSTPLDAARTSNATDVVEWLQSL